MLEVLDEAEVEQHTKKANTTGRSPEGTPANNAEPTGGRVGEDPPVTSAAAALQAANSRIEEAIDTSDKQTGKKPLYKRPVVLVIASSSWLSARSSASTTGSTRARMNPLTMLSSTLTLFRSAQKLPATWLRFTSMTTSKLKLVT